MSVCMSMCICVHIRAVCACPCVSVCIAMCVCACPCVSVCTPVLVFMCVSVWQGPAPGWKGRIPVLPHPMGFCFLLSAQGRMHSPYPPRGWLAGEGQPCPNGDGGGLRASATLWFSAWLHCRVTGDSRKGRPQMRGHRNQVGGTQGPARRVSGHLPSRGSELGPGGR